MANQSQSNIPREHHRGTATNLLILDRPPEDLLGIDEDLAKQFADILVTEEDSEDIDADENEKKKRRNQQIRDGEGMHKFKHNFGGKNGKIKANNRRCPVEIMRPGFCRLNLPYFFDDEVIEYILEAVDNLATYGWRLLPQFTIDIHSGTWTNNYPKQDQVDGGDNKGVGDSLLAAQFVDGKFKAPPSPFRNIQSTELKKHLEDALKIFQEASHDNMIPDSAAMEDDLSNAIGDDRLIWFLRPHEALWHLQNPSQSRQMNRMTKRMRRSKSGKVDPTARANNVPFRPKRYARYTLRLSRKSRQKQRQYASEENGGTNTENHNNGGPATEETDGSHVQCCAIM